MLLINILLIDVSGNPDGDISDHNAEEKKKRKKKRSLSMWPSKPWPSKPWPSKTWPSKPHGTDIIVTLGSTLLPTKFYSQQPRTAMATSETTELFVCNPCGIFCNDIFPLVVHCFSIFAVLGYFFSFSFNFY